MKTKKWLQEHLTAVQQKPMDPHLNLALPMLVINHRMGMVSHNT
jgi:hypothetical protein